MPADKEARPLASPWKEFLTELDGMLNEPLELHCIGGFVFTYFYGLPRTTGEIDYYTAIPVNLNLDKVAGQGSHLRGRRGYTICGLSCGLEKIRTRRAPWAKWASLSSPLCRPPHSGAD